MTEKCIVSISHSNYLIKNAGTEKCMREIQKVLLDSNIHYFQIFSFEKYSNLYKMCDMSDKIGVNYDNQFLGIYSYKSLPRLINEIQKRKNVRMTGLHINNVINHDLGLLKAFLKTIDLPIVVWIHDYSAVCEKSPILLLESGVACNNFSKDVRICSSYSKCKDYCRGKDSVYEFYKDIDYLVESVIAPSDCVIRNILNRYYFWKEKIILRPHLKLSGIQERKKLSYPLRIAFIGGKYVHKGIDEWKVIIETFKNSPYYKFYYLGSSVENSLTEENKVFVDISLQGDMAMLNAIRENNIDLAFLWSKCQETYSYTYYEALCGGTRIITSTDSGNIADSVIKDGAGLVFENFHDLIDEMKDCKRFKENLEQVSNTCPLLFEINSSLKHIVPNGDCSVPNTSKKIKRYKLLTTAYIVSNIIKRVKAVSRIEKQKCHND